MFVSMVGAVAAEHTAHLETTQTRHLLLRWGSLVVGAGVGAAIVASLGRGWVGSGLLVVAVAAMLVALLVHPLAPGVFVGTVALGATVLVGGGWLATRALGGPGGHLNFLPPSTAGWPPGAAADNTSTNANPATTSPPAATKPAKMNQPAGQHWQPG